MSKHDTWAELIDGHPFEQIDYLFPDGYPLRDPFPLMVAQTEDENIALFVIDIQRLDPEQIDAIAEVLAEKYNITKQEMLEDAKVNPFCTFCIQASWIESLSGDAEAYRRNIEFLDYFDGLNGEPTKEQLQSFMRQQKADWIDGNKIPEPMPEKYQDVDPRMKCQGLEDAYRQRDINEFMTKGNYSVLDVLLGKPIQDYFDHLDEEGDLNYALDN
jgi:hypothetical protein